MNTRNALFAICILSSLGRAQGGTGTGGCNVGPGFECSMVHGHEGGGLGERNWVRAIVLWNADAAVQGIIRDTARARLREQRYTATRRAVEDSGRVLIGVVGTTHLSVASLTWGFGRRTRDTLFVLDRQFELSRRDSALVVLVEVEAGESARTSRIAGAVWISPELDPSYWPKHWRSGDTSFTVMPRRENSILRDALMKSPAIRSFLQRAP